MISLAYPKLKLYYAMLCSLFFSIPYSICGIFGGTLTQTKNRKWLITVALIIWSFCSFMVGAYDSLVVFTIFRALLGVFTSMNNPASYALIADYFPLKYRSTANAIQASGEYIGSCIASFMVILVKKYGWRSMYKIQGAFGILFGVFTLLTLKEPIRGRFSKPVTPVESEPAQNAQLSV